MPTRGASPGLCHSSLSKCQVQAACRTHSGNCFYFSNLTLRPLQFQAPWLRGSQLARPTSGRTGHWIHNPQGVCLQDTRGSSSLTSLNPRTISTWSEDTLTSLGNNWVMSLKPSASLSDASQTGGGFVQATRQFAGRRTNSCVYVFDRWAGDLGSCVLGGTSMELRAVLPRSCCSISKGPSLY